MRSAMSWVGAVASGVVAGVILVVACGGENRRPNGGIPGAEAAVDALSISVVESRSSDSAAGASCPADATAVALACTCTLPAVVWSSDYSGNGGVCGCFGGQAGQQTTIKVTCLRASPASTLTKGLRAADGDALQQKLEEYRRAASAGR